MRLMIVALGTSADFVRILSNPLCPPGCFRIARKSTQRRVFAATVGALL